MVRISFLGDISLNNAYHELAKNKIDPFKAIIPYLTNSDYVVGNLEAVFEGHSEIKNTKLTKLKTTYESLSLIEKLNLNMVTLANNHIYDELLAGFDKTIQFLEKNNIEYIGANKKVIKQAEPFIKKIDNNHIAFLNYVHNGTNPGFPKDISINVNIYDTKEICQKISDLKNQVDFIILILHWGMDNSRFPEPWQRKDADAFITAGADLIVGHHSHVLQGFEKIKGKMVFYSLGNFAFASIKNEEDSDLDRSRQVKSIILNCNIRNKQIEFNWQPFRINKLLLESINKVNIKRLSLFIPIISNKVVFPIYKFYLNKIYKIYFYFLGNGRNPITQFKKIDLSKFNRAKKILGI